jgi:hypothetical protein
MTIVTLTTDFGIQDYYSALMKGALMKVDSAVNIIDITHFVEPFDIVQGAFVLKNCYNEFPGETLHIISISHDSQVQRFILFKHLDFYFLGPDNGIFSLILETADLEAYEVQVPTNQPFPLKDAAAIALRHIISGKAVHEIGPKVHEIEKRIALQPVISASYIRGSVVYIDHYENVILNIGKELFEKIRNGRNFALYFKRHDPIRKLCKYYSEVPVGEILCWFNAAGFLEIAINMGKAASMLGLQLDDMVQIDFSTS